MKGEDGRQAAGNFQERSRPSRDLCLPFLNLLFDPSHIINDLLPSVNNYVHKESEHKRQGDIIQLGLEHQRQSSEISGKKTIYTQKGKLLLGISIQTKSVDYKDNIVANNPDEEFFIDGPPDGSSPSKEQFNEADRIRG